MPEIKTCEQYVLNELFNEQEKNKQLEKTISNMKYDFNSVSNENVMLKIQIKQLQSELNTLKGIEEIEK